MRKAMWLCFFVALLSAGSALAQSGRIDVSFNAPEFSGYPFLLWSKADGRLVVIAHDPANSWYYAKKAFTLTDSGAIDPTFNPMLPADFTPVAGTVDSNENIVLAGEFGMNHSEVSLIRLLPTGSVDSAYNTPTFPIYPGSEWALMLEPAASGAVWVNVLKPDSLQALNLIGGDGSIQRTLAVSVDVSVQRFQLQGPNLIVKAAFTSGDTGIIRLGRVLPDNSFDSTFQSLSYYYQIQSFIVDSANRILVAGYHLKSPGVREVFWRLLPDGALDPAFPPVTSDGNIYAIALQSDGKILVRGSFSILSGIARPSLARLNTDGSVDITFNPAGATIGITASELGVVVQPDGRIVTVSDSLNGPAALFRLWGDKFLRFDGLSIDSGGAAQLSFTNTTSQGWVLQTSTDLKTWQPVVTNENSAVELRFDGVAAGLNYFRGILR